MDSLKNILITGATSGIGKELTSYLLRSNNYAVYGIGRDESKLGELVDSPNFHFIQCDLNDLASISNIFNLEIIQGVKFAGFVHCAGIEETLPLSLYTPDRVQAIFQINVFAAIEILRSLSKKRNTLDEASFVLISSVMGELGQAGKVGYCASKAALLGVVKSLSLELAKRKIRVNAVSPGIVETPLTEKLFSQLDEQSIERIKGMHPIGFGRTTDISHIVEFLLSDKSKWITGQNIKIDGGYSVH